MNKNIKFVFIMHQVPVHDLPIIKLCRVQAITEYNMGTSMQDTASNTSNIIIPKLIMSNIQGNVSICLRLYKAFGKI